MEPVPSAEDFDFWLGSWIVRWDEADGETGRNVITRTFGDHVVEERFDGRPGVDLVGTTSPSSTCTASSGARPGSTTRGTTSRSRASRGRRDAALRAHDAPEPDAVYRMRFFDIAQDTLTWTRERSVDAGTTFEELWRLAYERASTADRSLA